MKTIVNEHARVSDVRNTLIVNANCYTDHELWQALRNERKQKNRITVVRMLRRALRRQLNYVAILLTIICLTTSCSAPSKLTAGELEALTAYNRAEYKEVTVQQRIYYLDSTTVWTPCGEGWYCRSREIEQYMNDMKNLKKRAQ